ncbi:MAG: hypothetical protein ABIG37_03055 [Nanoarchaeota archaeon]|nr:hypothetical protein [Nanoarchaeota archaeon]
MTRKSRRHYAKTARGYGDHGKKAKPQITRQGYNLPFNNVGLQRVSTKGIDLGFFPSGDGAAFRYDYFERLDNATKLLLSRGIAFKIKDILFYNFSIRY